MPKGSPDFEPPALVGDDTRPNLLRRAVAMTVPLVGTARPAAGRFSPPGHFPEYGVRGLGIDEP
jgi:hypothetical protein